MELTLANNTTVSFYDDITDLPIKLFNLSNEYSMQDFEIGNTMEDVNNHYRRWFEKVHQGKTDDALLIMKNMYQTHYMMLSQINFKSLVFGCMVKSINGVAPNYDPDAMRKWLDDLSDKGLTEKMVEQIVHQLKKKLKGN